MVLEGIFRKSQVHPFVFADHLSFVFVRGYASAVRHLLNFLAWLCARCSCISDHHEFHCGVRLHRNAEQTRQHIQVDAWIRMCQLLVVFCISEAVCHVLLCRVVNVWSSHGPFLFCVPCL